MLWSSADIADAVAAALQRRAHADDAEQAVYGFDTLDELRLHPLIREALTQQGYGAWPEQRYPGAWKRRSKAEGKRCDLVLTHDGRPLRDPEVRGTIFDALGEAADPEAAYWLEIKTVAQFETTGPFRRYAAELLAPVAEDVKKLKSDRVIQHAGLLLVLFTADRETAEHDIAAWHKRCLDRGHLMGAPATRGFAITDRTGNQWCAVAVFNVRG
ncbi:hypothetical protein ACERK3_13480 [Phycisphaerales bacterium AB-hyl4]|uniref:Uncharacterized protein n=1 Tax=Natronomicrosphaera hydrolytica TaxID=3242702 RepID=A0ABV4U6S0_9BACT